MKNILKSALTLFIVTSIYTSVNAQTASTNTEKSDIFTLVEEMPMINRCAVRVMTEDEKKECTAKEMMNIIAENIKYPAQAKKDNISGIVYVAFVIDEFGNVTNVEVLKGTNELLDKEAVKAVKATNGSWIAGKQDGKNVKVKYTVPIKFSL
jgi:protein TonB